MEKETLTERFEQSINRIFGLIGEINNNENITTANADEILCRGKGVLEILLVFLGQADPLIVSHAQLESLQSQLTNAESYLGSFRDNPPAYPNYLQSFDSIIESIRAIMPHIIPKPIESNLTLIRDSIAAIRRNSSQNLKSISQEFETKLSKIDAIYKQKENELQETYENRTQEFEDEIKIRQDDSDDKLAIVLGQLEKIKELSTETTDDIKSQKKRLDDAIAEFQKQFSERIDGYQKQFSDAEEERRNKLDLSIQSRERAYKKETTERVAELKDWRDEFQMSFSKDREQFEKVSKTLIETIRNFAQEAKVTVGLMSEKSLQNDYDIQAKDEKTRARYWNVATFLTVGLLLAAVGYIFVHTIVNPLPADQTGYPQILGKFLITGVIGIIARWTSRQANRHLAEERRLRRLALELATINPFINNLPDKVKHKIKELLAMRYYGNLSDEKAPFGEVSIPQDSEAGLKTLPETIVDKFRGK